MTLVSAAGTPCSAVARQSLATSGTSSPVVVVKSTFAIALREHATHNRGQSLHTFATCRPSCRAFVPRLRLTNPATRSARRASGTGSTHLTPIPFN